MRNELCLIQETLDLALYMLDCGELSGEDYYSVVKQLESDYNSLIVGDMNRSAGQLIEFLLLNKKA